MLYIEIDGVERTSRIQFNRSLHLQDNINQQRDTLNFEVKKTPADSWYPVKGSNVVVGYGDVEEAVVDSYSEANKDSQMYVSAGGTSVDAIGQAFHNENTLTLKNADFYVAKVGSPTGSVYVKIYALSGQYGVSAVPTGSPLAVSDPVDVSALATTHPTYALKTFTFSGDNQIILQENTNYFVVLEYGGGDDSNKMGVGVDTSSPSHGGNYSYTLDGTSWINPSEIDVCFYVRGLIFPRIFGGTITRVERAVESVNLVTFRCEAVDWAFELDRRLVVERYTSEYISDIISNLITTYAPEFTMTAVVGEQVVNSIVFNNIKVSECLEKLAQVTGYSWYVDAYKDIHFFPKNEESAPFNLTDTSENYVWESLVITDDASQLRNSILVKGGEIQGNEVSEEYTATGTEDERRLFPTAHKIATLPQVQVNGGAALNVGVEYLNSDADFDVMWDFNQKYIRFTDGNIPAANDVITLTGTPLYRLSGRLNDSDSIRENGIYEFKIEDDNIKSQSEMLLRAEAELEAYKNGVVEAEFRTYTPGLRSGQVITITSPLRVVSESFLIQSVDFEMQSPTEDGVWNVRLATLRTVGVIEFLQRMLRNNGVDDGANDLLLSFFQYDDEATADDSVSALVQTSPPYTWEDNPPTPQANPIVWNFFTWT